MYTGKTLFTQLMDFLPWTTFTRIVNRYGGDYKVRTLRCTEHYRVMAFAQLTYRESLHDWHSRGVLEMAGEAGLARTEKGSDPFRQVHGRIPGHFSGPLQ